MVIDIDLNTFDNFKMHKINGRLVLSNLLFNIYLRKKNNRICEGIRHLYKKHLIFRNPSTKKPVEAYVC